MFERGRIQGQKSQIVFDTLLNLRNGFAGIRSRRSVRISWLLPMV